MNKEIKLLNIRYFLLQVLFWGAAVVVYAYMTQILEYKGYSQVEIGILYAAKLIVSVFFQIWIGAYADKRVYSFPVKYIVAILSVVSALLIFLVYIIGHRFFPMLLIFLALGIAFTTISPLIDSMSLLYVNHGQNVNFAKGRAGGSISWAFLCVLAGIFCDRFGMLYFPLFGVLLSLMMAWFSMTMKWDAIRMENSCSSLTGDAAKSSCSTLTTSEKKMPTKPHSTLYLLRKYTVYTIFLIGSALMFMGYNFGTVFLIDVFTGLGGNNTHYGISQFVMAIVEVPSVLIILKAKKKMSMKWLMVCCAFFMTLKNLIPTFATHIWVVIAAQACEMLGFGLFYSGGIYMIEELIPEADSVKATTLISVFTVGIGEGIASLFIGAIHNQFGLYGVMKAGTLANALAIFVMLSMFLVKDRSSQRKNVFFKNQLLKSKNVI